MNRLSIDAPLIGLLVPSNSISTGCPAILRILSKKKLMTSTCCLRQSYTRYKSTVTPSIRLRWRLLSRPYWFSCLVCCCCCDCCMPCCIAFCPQFCCRPALFGGCDAFEFIRCGPGDCFIWGVWPFHPGNSSCSFVYSLASSAGEAGIDMMAGPGCNC